MPLPITHVQWNRKNNRAPISHLIVRIPFVFSVFKADTNRQRTASCVRVNDGPVGELSVLSGRQFFCADHMELTHPEGR